MVSLRELWTTIKDKLQELLYIVFNYLRTLDPIDIMHAFDILMACRDSRRELVYTMLDFIAVKLGRQVISCITAGQKQFVYFDDIILYVILVNEKSFFYVTDTTVCMPLVRLTFVIQNRV